MIYDALIVGGGPAGISAAIQLKRANKNVAIIERFAAGGQLNMLGMVENYPGFASVDGSELAAMMRAHAKKFEIPFIFDEALEYNLKGEVKKVKCARSTYEARCVVLALGSYSRALNIEGEERFKGRGVSYCAVCDGNFFKGKTVAVVGSGDSAAADTIYLSNIAEKVYLICDELELSRYKAEQLILPNVKIMKNSTAIEIKGDKQVKKLLYKQNNTVSDLDVDAVFVAIGRMPQTQNLIGQVELDERGYIITDEQMRTSCPGVFACGDARNGMLKQIATAVGEGSIAGMNCLKYRPKETN